ncbi:preprotein translocase subunit SecE [Heliomicrobium gestii]|nr:preprotein translocase subunit SecE [Heliomicrobium gestii]MBM7865907.1 preprotein translocase subunit SecE [Heliomicrobium gestii]
MGEIKPTDKPEKVEKTENTTKATPVKDAAKKGEPAKKPAVTRSSTMERSQNFARGVASEMKKVHWPTRQEVITYTGVVLTAVVFVSALIFVVDEALSLALKQLIR